ncbi:MAG: hypothetical protein ABEH60_03185 [Halonotius sp.]
MTIDRTTTADESAERLYREYISDVCIVEIGTETDEGMAYRFDAPEHTEITFDDPRMATLYTDIYFSVNGFVEAGTGERGIPPEIVQAGKHTLAAYLVVQTSRDWAASFCGADPEQIEQYVSRVRQEADEIRTAVTNEMTATTASG